MNRREFMGSLAAASAAGRAHGAPDTDVSRITAAGCCLNNLGFEGTLHKILELGFTGVEIATFVEKNGPSGDTFPYAVVDQLDESAKTRLKTLVKRFRHVSTHLPYYPDFRPIAKDPAVREKSRRELFRSADDSGFWGASVATVHVVSEKGVPFREALPELVAFYRELGDRAGRHGVRLAIETTRPYRIAEYLELIRAVDRANVGANVDVGHMIFFREDVGVDDADRATPRGRQRYNDVLLEVIRSLGPKLFHLHIHDVRAKDWQDHHLPGTGIVDFARVFRELKGKYTGLFAAELLHYDGPQAGQLRAAREYWQELLRRA